jgi:hypothetical protein
LSLIGIHLGNWIWLIQSPGVLCRETLNIFTWQLDLADSKSRRSLPGNPEHIYLAIGELSLNEK